jgi:hypothetical protein
MTVIYQVDRVNPIYAFPWTETSGLEEMFLQLVQQWQQETGMLSLVQKMVMHPAYQRIIGMGQPVVPLILRELEQEADHWFWALQAITGANPVQISHQGKLDAMASDWLDWGRDNGYRW